MVLTFEFVDEILTCKCDIQMKAIEYYLVLFVMLYKVVLTFESVNEMLQFYQSNESD